jgi:sarcosine oxidase subunit beta
MAGVAVTVIGAGVVGSSIALALARDGHQVTVVDRAPGPGLGSTSASSAIVRFHYSTYEGVALAWEAKHEWERWPDYLGVADPAGLARYQRTGVLVLDTPGYDVERVITHYDRLRIPYERLTAAQLRARFPYLSTSAYYPPRALTDPDFWRDSTAELGGMWTPEGGFVDDPSLAAHNLWSAATAIGTRSRFRAEVVEVRRDSTGVTGVRLADGETIAAEVVINAAGPHSVNVNRLAGVLDDFAVSTRPLRQEVHNLAAPATVGGELGPTVGDGDLGTYFRFAPGGQILVGSQEPDCDPLEWLDDADDCSTSPTAAVFERQTLRLARRIPLVTVPLRPSGIAGVYDVTADWIPIYDKTALPGYYVAIGTSGNQFKNAPCVGPLMAALVADGLQGGDHDAEPVDWSGPRTGVRIGLRHYSRRRRPNPSSSNSVLG